jgi:hypothetical protein
MNFFESAAQSKILIFNSAIFACRFHYPPKKVGKLPVSHRYNRLPLLSSDPGGVQQELAVQDLPACKSRNFYDSVKLSPGGVTFFVLCRPTYSERGNSFLKQSEGIGKSRFVCSALQDEKKYPIFAYLISLKPYIMETKKLSLWKSGLTYGIYLGLVLILYSVILYLAGQTFNKWLGYLSILIIIVGIIWAQLSFRKAQGDVMTYGQGVGLAAVMMIFAGVLSAIYTILLYKIIDPDLYDQSLLFYEEQATNSMMKRGLSDAQISQGLELSKRFQTPIFIALAALVNYIIYGVIVSLITSIFVKKNPMEEVVE